jgi:hypothetical protein
MFRKSIIAVVLSIALLFIVVTLANAQEPGQAIHQMDMPTATATAAPEATPATDVPLSGDLPLSGAQSGTCPMMSGSGMTGMGTGMGNMAGMQGMSGTGMNGMSGMGMNGMSGGMMNMEGMSGMNGTMAGYPVPWYSNPWWLLGWVLLALVVLAILFGAAYGLIQLTRRSKSENPPASS